MPSCATIKLMILLRFIIIFGMLVTTTMAYELLTDPAVSRRCDALTKKRLSTIEFKQRVYALLERNKQALKAAPYNRKTLREKLKRNYKSLSKRLEMSHFQIEQQEEQIIRKGCPSIPL